MILLLNTFIKARYKRFHQRQQLQDWQAQQVDKHLAWVCRHSPYYRALQGAKLDQFPIMNKQQMMANFDQLNTCGLEQAQLFECAINAEKKRHFSDSAIGDITVGLSSGTSGQRGLFLASPQERQIWAGNILGKLLPSLITKHRIALVLRANSPLYGTVNKGPIQFCYIDITLPIEVWMKQLDVFQPSLLIGSAQALQLCALYTGKYSQKAIQPQRIISGAEVLTPADKHWLQQKFNCPIHEIYQCTEGFLGCTDQQGQMRWNEDIVLIEKHWLNAEKTHYSPIITDFRRRTQPVIRYQLDDIIVAKQDSGIFEAIGAIAGRCGDCLSLLGQGRQKGCKVPVLPDLIYRAITLKIDEHCDYKISQLADDCIEIAAEPTYHQRIQQALSELFAQQNVLPVTFMFAPKPVWQAANKQRRVINLCGS
ncbi:F390 synthetase-related protein [Motilimonas sp. E26]|uniref:F390 synthetase-related protein n=1 Tax=Motilimonas sp. E26 TaxID=2865674 RepID=UPI001E5698CE|nr:hypothetical protein [Motilimonas sp. E26]